MACTWVSAWRGLIPAPRTTAPTVFSCAASRNKRARELSTEPIGNLEPGLAPFHILAVRRTARAGATPGVGLQRRRAHFRPRWLRPVLRSPILSGSGYALRVWAEGPARRPGDPAGRKSNNPFIAQGCRVRPVAHPPEALRAWATRPAILRIALLALSFSSSPPAGAQPSLQRLRKCH